MGAQPTHKKHFSAVHLWSLLGLFFLIPTWVQAQPTPIPQKIHLEYEVTRDGKPFATVTEDFHQTENQYHITSVTKGLGVYALLGERKLSSHGEVTRDGLKPHRFELHQGNNAKKSLMTDFNWTNNTLNMQIKGETKTLPLEAGTQDLLSYAYQWMWMNLLPKDSVTMTLTTGKKINQYHYQVQAETVTIHHADTSYNTLHLTPTITEGKRIWLGVAQHHLPVRIVWLDENNASIEQTLTSFALE